LDHEVCPWLLFDYSSSVGAVTEVGSTPLEDFYYRFVVDIGAVDYVLWNAVAAVLEVALKHLGLLGLGR
jgi:hypothetical protein